AISSQNHSSFFFPSDSTTLHSAHSFAERSCIQLSVGSSCILSIHYPALPVYVLLVGHPVQQAPVHNHRFFPLAYNHQSLQSLHSASANDQGRPSHQVSSPHHDSLWQPLYRLPLPANSSPKRLEPGHLRVFHPSQSAFCLYYSGIFPFVV